MQKIAAALILLALGAPAYAQTLSSAPASSAAPKFNHIIRNLPGKSLVAVEVTYPPGGASLPHHHADSAFIFAYVLSGSVRSQVEGEPVKVYSAGESWYEDPKAHHVVSQNASQTEPAKLLAVFVVDSADTVLTRPDQPGK